MQRSIVQLSPDENYSSVGTSWKYHSIKTAYPMKIESEFAIENGPVEIVSFSMKKMVDLSSSLCKRLPEGKYQILNIKSMDWFCWEDLHRKPWFLPSKCSGFWLTLTFVQNHPILW